MEPHDRDDSPDLKWIDAPPRLLITTLMDCRLFIGTCPTAQTLEAYSNTYQCTVWIPLRCKRWSCRHCADMKVASLARRTHTAQPNRLLTLTVDPSLHADPRAAFDATRRKIPDLIKALRDKFGEVEYLRVTEITAKGWPHYHLLVRSPYLPHAVIQSLWKTLTGAIIVDVRQVKEHFNATLYLIKYLSKLHSLGWTERHCSHSRNFFPPKEPQQDDGLALTDFKVLESHPADLVYHQFRNSELVEIQYGVFTLNPSEDILKLRTDTGDSTIALSKGKAARSSTTF